MTIWGAIFVWTKALEVALVLILVLTDQTIYIDYYSE